MNTVVGLALLVGLSLAKDQCDVTVLYESHCPDSHNFIHQELVPIWHKLEPHCSLQLVAFGKARSTETGFICQHGEKECRGNMAMSCAFQKLSPGRQQLNFASCFMANPDYGGPKCAEETGIPSLWSDVESCMQSEEGRNLQLVAERKSHHIQQSGFVPTILINEVYKQSDQNAAVRGRFKSLMCSYVKSSDICT